MNSIRSATSMMSNKNSNHSILLDDDDESTAAELNVIDDDSVGTRESATIIDAPPQLLNDNATTTSQWEEVVATDESPTIGVVPKRGRGRPPRRTGAIGQVTATTIDHLSPSAGRGGTKRNTNSSIDRRILPDRASRVRSFVALENGGLETDASSRSIAKPTIAVAPLPKRPRMIVTGNTNVVRRVGSVANDLPPMSPPPQLQRQHRLPYDMEESIHSGDVIGTEDVDDDDYVDESERSGVVDMAKRSSLSTVHDREQQSGTGDLEEAGILLHDNELPLYADYAIDFPTACEIIMNMTPIDPAHICTSVPQQYTGQGTFIIDMNNFSNRHEIALDGLGSWGRPQGSSRFYQLTNTNNLTTAERVESNSDYGIKVLCNRYQHPGTDWRGRFHRKIYTATSSTTGPLPIAIITYEWRGDPHPIEFYETNTTAKPSCRPYGNRSWEINARNVNQLDASVVVAGEWDGEPIYANGAIDFESVSQILLNAVTVPEDRLCRRVPQGYRLNSTFVIDLRSSGICENDLRKDGNGYWSKPSGCSRYYKISRDTSDVVRVDRAQPTSPNGDYDVQILSKRYENEHPSTNGRFVRKIYIGKGRNAKQLQSCCDLAVITYFWKGDPVDFDIGDMANTSQTKLNSAKKRRIISSEAYEATTPILEEEMDSPGANVTLMSVDSASNLLPRRPIRAMASASNSTNESTTSNALPLSGLVLGHADHLKRLTLAKELENQNRLSALLDRADQFLDRFEQAGMALGLGGGAGGGGTTVSSSVASSSTAIVDSGRQQFVGVDGTIWETTTNTTTAAGGGGANDRHGHHHHHRVVVDEMVHDNDYITTADGQQIVVPAGFTVQNVSY